MLARDETRQSTSHWATGDNKEVIGKRPAQARDEVSNSTHQHKSAKANNNRTSKTTPSIAKFHSREY